VVCVCGVLATWHCETCDTPVCEQHRDRYWPGLQSRQKHLANGAVEAIWRGSAELDAGELRPGVHQLCTVCRAETAEKVATEYAATTERPPASSFARTIALAHLGQNIEPTTALVQAAISQVIELRIAAGWTTSTIAADWKTSDGVTKRISSTLEAWRLTGTTDSALLLTPSWTVAGPLKLGHVKSVMGAKLTQKVLDCWVPKEPSPWVTGNGLKKFRSCLLRTTSFPDQAEGLGYPTWKAFLLDLYSEAPPGSA
jgi:hypothetical protein